MASDRSSWSLSRRGFLKGSLGLGASLTFASMFGRSALAAPAGGLSAQETTYTELEKKLADEAFAAMDKGNPDPAWKGKTISVGVIGQGPHGGISGPWYFWRPYFQQLTGADIEVIEIPFGELRTKFVNDVSTGTGRYDIMMPGAWFYGDLVPYGYIIPIDQYFDDARMPKWDRDALPPSIKTLYTWGGKWYGCTFDCDAQVLYFRRDILVDQNDRWNPDFKAKYGYDLPKSPETWQQVRDIAEFFNGKDWNGDGEADNGIAMHVKVGGQGFFHFMSLSAPFVVNPGDKVDSIHNIYWFDPETMEPLIDSPGHLAALEMVIELTRHGSPAMKGWSLGEAWNDFLTGKALMVFSWGDVGSLSQDPTQSKIKGKLGAAPIPGSMTMYDREKKQMVTLDKPNFVSNTVGGSWHPVISKLSKNPDLAYYAAAMQATQPINFWNVTRGWAGTDAGPKYTLLPPYGTAKVEDYVASGFDPGDAEQYVNAYGKQWFGYQTTQTYLRIPGTPEYWEALDIHLSEAITGQLSAKDALARTKEDWEQTTDKLGREDQLKFYREAIGYTG